MNEQLKERLESIRDRIETAAKRSGRAKDAVKLIAVTKTYPASALQELIDLGVRDLGENRADEIVSKAPELKGDYELHMIGHLQTNKVARVLPHVKWIQSIDRQRLISRIEFLHSGSPIKALVEVNTSGEESKTGCTPQECRQICELVAKSSALRFCGLMTIGPLEGGEKKTREAFTMLRELAQDVKDLSPQPELSMGMSGDFEWAIEEGATMVRIGTLLLGGRHR